MRVRRWAAEAEGAGGLGAEPQKEKEIKLGRAGPWTTAVGDEEGIRAGQNKSWSEEELVRRRAAEICSSGFREQNKMKVLTQGQLGGNNSNIKEADVTKDSGLACCCLWETAGQKEI